jgi:hypothetical protein
MKNRIFILAIFTLLGCNQLKDNEQQETLSFHEYNATKKELTNYIKDTKLTEIEKFPVNYQSSINVIVEYYRNIDKNPDKFFVDSIALVNDSILYISTLHLNGYIYSLNLDKEMERIENSKEEFVEVKMVPITGNVSGEDRFFHVSLKGDSVVTQYWYQ